MYSAVSIATVSAQKSTQLNQIKVQNINFTTAIVLCNTVISYFYKNTEYYFNKTLRSVYGTLLVQMFVTSLHIIL